MLPTEITVTLTTSQNMIMCSDSKAASILQSKPLPVCVAEYKIDNESDYKIYESFLQVYLLKQCGDIFIDTNNYIFKIREKTGFYFLIETYYKNPTKIQKEFFEAYKNFSALLLEYQIFLKDKIKFCLKGLWLRDSWIQLKINKEGFIHITPPSILN